MNVPRTSLAFLLVLSPLLVSARASAGEIVDDVTLESSDGKTVIASDPVKTEEEIKIEESDRTVTTTTDTKVALTTPTLTPLPTTTTEEVVDLGQYDPLPALHPSYALPPVADPAPYQMAPPNLTYDPCPTPSATTNWDRVFSKAGDFGNNTVGAGYWSGLTFSSRAGVTPSSDSFTGEALLRAYVTVFSTDYELARMSGKAGLVGTYGSASYLVRVLGADVRTGSASGNLTGNPTHQATFLSKSSPTIWLGPLPVVFRASVNGTIGVDYRAEYAMSTISLTAKPTGRLYATATASVDAWLASAGVTGTVTLIQADVPSRAQVIVGPSTLAYGLRSDLVLSSLSGRIDAWAHVPGKTWTMNLASWAPLYQGTFAITNINSCQNPIVRPTCGNMTCESGESHDTCPSDCAAPPPPPPEAGEPEVPIYCTAKPWMCSDL